jgi:NhaP-type Na+/H+ or K+/H+ antiporter
VTWRLLAVTMPLTIVAIAAMGLLPLGLPLASAVLLGAVLAPTDPVLASDVEIEGPTEEDDDDDVRFALTSEAGLNDGLAFPFTNLAIALATATAGGWAFNWVVEDVVVRLSVGLLVGWLLGRAIAWLAFRLPSRSALARTSEGFVAVGATLAIYGITEMAHGYGFLAVFVAAVTIRNEERNHDYQQILHDFAQTIERFASIVFLLLLGGAIVDGALGALTPAGAVVAFAIVLVVRPAAGLIGLWGEPLPASEKVAIAFFGIRGMGTVYYLAHASTEERFTGVDQIWAVAVLVIVLSIVVHGVSTTPALRYIDRRRELREN